MFGALMLTAALGLTVLLPQTGGTRLEQIRQRGTLGCGVEPDVPGFAEVDAEGRYRGLDVDICRAVAAAIFGTPDNVRYIRATSVDEFRRRNEIDIVSRRISWELRRENPLGLLFGPVTFFDGQGFLVSNTLNITTPAQLTGMNVCVA